MADLRKFANTSNLVRFVLVNSSTGAGLTALTSASSGLIISTIADDEATATAYTVAGSTIETISTLGTFATPTATKCRFKEVDATNHPGLYEFQFADARFAVTSAKRMVVSVTGAASLLTCHYEIALVQFDPYDAVRLGLTAIPNVASGSAGAIVTSGTGTAQLSVSSGLVTLAGVTHTGAVIPTVTTLTNLPAVTTDWLTGTGVAASAVTKIQAGLATPTNITAGTITTVTTLTNLPAITTDWLTGTGVAASAVTKIQAGLATPTNITAGTITTATNLTNAPTSGDFTATMKTSIGTAVAASAVASVTARVTANTDQLAGQTVSAAAGVTFPTSVASPTNITAGTITTTTNLTNAPTAGDFTSTMKTSIGTAVAASNVAGVAGVTFPATVASPTNITAGTITTVTNLTNAPSAGDFTSTMKTSIGTAVAASSVAGVTGLTASAIATAVLTTQMTESYNVDGTAPTLAQAQFVQMQRLTEFSVGSTTITVKKLDGTTTAYTLTMDAAASSATSSTRGT